MIPIRWLSFGIILLAVSNLFAQSAPPKKKKSKAKPSAAAQAQPDAAATQPTPPPAPLTRAQKPAVAPTVKYQNGELTILAENSTLGDILRAVHQQTGAIVDMPSNATERVVADLGPGPARDVLATLLNGSSFNYVMLGSPTDPNDVKHVIVTARSGGEAEAVAANQPQPGFNGRTPMAPQNQPMITGGAPDSGAEADSTADDAATDDQAQGDDLPQPEGQPADQAPAANQNGIKTPEQLLQELQRQQQMQQQQQQAPQSAPQGFPPPPQNPEPQ